MSKKGLTGAISWIFERARRSSERIMKNFCDEQKFEMAGLDPNMIPPIHTLALFDTLRQVNMPKYLISGDTDVEKNILHEYVDFLDDAYQRFQELAQTIRDWEPKANKDKSPTKNPLSKHSHPRDN